MIPTLTPEQFPPAIREWLAAEIPTLEGWCSPEKAARLTELVIATHAERSVDLGVFGGRSLLALALGHRLRGPIGRGYAVGIDPFTIDAVLQGTNDPENDEWWKKLNLDALRQWVTHYFQTVTLPTGARLFPQAVLKFESSLTAHTMFADHSIHLLHQDSNHSEEISNRELLAWWPKLAPGGLWIMDDAEWPTLQKVQRELTQTWGAVLIEDYQQWRVYQGPGEATWRR